MCNIKKTTIIATDLSLRTDTNSTESQKAENRSGEDAKSCKSENSDNTTLSQTAATGINRQHKDRLFKLLFRNPDHKDWTLSLYNAINRTDYTDPDDINFTTIEDALYMGMKNDVSFLLMDTMSFYEQQSSFNPNIPMRLLVYVGMVYSAFIQAPENNINMFSSRQQTFPAPKLVCFYNGTNEQPDTLDLWLSSAFDNTCVTDIDVRVTMLNINSGHNRELLEVCQPLREYSEFVDTIRKARIRFRNISDAVNFALDTLPDTALIKPLLIANKAEVKQMFITEYDEAATMDKFRKEWIEIGVKQGFDIGVKQGAKEADRKRMESDALGMAQKGLSPEDIAEIQKVDLKVIREILGLDTQIK